MEGDLISVVVPVYNVEKFLDRCMANLLSQTYKDYEILLIDDGSKDSSGALCDRYAAICDNVRVFHKDNGGLGSARNYGIKHAKGNYVCFIDSDDQVTKEYLYHLYDAIKSNNADLCVCGYYYTSLGYTAVYEFEDAVLDLSETLERFASGNAFFNFAWNKLYKKEIIDKMPMHYSDRHCAEDMYFNAIYYRFVNRVATVKEPLYTYYVNLESLSNGRRFGFWNDMLLIYDAFQETCAVKEIPPGIANNLLVVMFRNSVSNYFNKKTTIRACRNYVAKCLEQKDIRGIEIQVNSLGRVDQLLYKAVLKGRYFLVYLYMKSIKWIKVRHFGIFCKIRQSVSG